MSTYEKARLETKNRIIQGFWKLYKQKPIHKITIQNVADVSKVHRSTVYFHFQDVYQILECIEADLLSNLGNIDCHTGETEYGLKSSGQTLFNEYRNHKEYLSILVKEKRDYSFAIKYREAMTSLMLNLAQNPNTINSSKNQKLLEITANTVVDIFLQCADDECLSFDDTQKLLNGYMRLGFYKTLDEQFHVAGLLNPH